MKTKLTSLLLAVAFICAGLFTACNTSQKSIAYKTLYGVEVATTGAYDGYIDLVYAKELPTNDVPKVSQYYNTFQSSMSIAVTIARGNMNAVAPANVIANGAAVVNLISTIKGK